MDPLLLLGVVISLLGVALLVVAVAQSIVYVKRQLAPTPYTCTCRHVVNAHVVDEHGGVGACTAEIARPYYDSIGERSGHEYVTCVCRRYVGERPPPELDELLRQLPPS